MIFPYLVTSVLVLLTIIVKLISFYWQFVPLAIYTCYSFVCIFSLCQKVREEKLRKKLNQYERTPTHEQPL
jgi:ABC-type bacteriocin/lantibiotic exporter with double-glycine peptidase domain